MNQPPPPEDSVLSTDLHIQAAYRLTEALVASEDRMRRRVELLSDVVFEADSRGTLQYLNGAWTAILGFDLGSSLGSQLQDYVIAEDRTSLAEHLDRIRVERLRAPVELRFSAKNGAVVPMELSASPLEEGGIVGTLHDVTQRNIVRAELAKLSLVASYTDSMVIITDAAGRVEWINQAFIRRTGYTLDECIGRKPGEFLQGQNTDPDTIRLISENLREVRSFQFEILNYTKSGEEYWVSIFITPILDRRGMLERFISVQNDVTMMRQMQHALRVAKDAADRASQAKSEFLAAMSHEIRTPLNGLLGMISLLLEGRLDPDQRQRANIIKSSGEALYAIVNDILDYSKIESGRFVLTSETFFAKEIMDDTLSLFRGNAGAKQLLLTGAFEGDETIPVVGDRGRLRQVLMNLVSNALKFTPKGQVRVEMTQRAINRRVEIAVRVTDTGIGIAESDLSRLFVHFSQIDGSATRKQGGTGLGLAISRQLVEMMGGVIGVDSTLGKGSTFWFSVRLGRGRKRATAKSAKPRDSQTSFAGIRALVAEDNTINQLVLRGILESLGIGSDVAKDGREAVTMAHQGEYDLILMDIHMPEMDGLEAAKAIREDSNAPIIAVTANVVPEHIRICYESGMDGFIAKPISRRAIESEIRRVLAPDSRLRREGASVL